MALPSDPAHLEQRQLSRNEHRQTHFAGTHVVRQEKFRHEKMRRIPLSIVSILIVGTGVISCDAPGSQSPSAPSVSYESRGTIDHAALVPLPGADSAAISEPSSSPAGG